MSHSGSPRANSLLAQAEQEAERYQWTAAAKLHEDALKEVDTNENPIKTAQIHEQLAYCRYMAAFQCKNRAQFKESMGQAESSYKDASNFYEKSDSDAHSQQAKARNLFAQYWIQDSNDERHNTIQQCINLGEKSATLLENQSDKKTLAEAHLDLLFYYNEAFILSPQLDERNQLFEKVLRIGEIAAREFGDLDLKRDLVRSLARAVSTACWMADTLSDPAKVQEIAKSLQIQAMQTMEVARQLGTAYELALAHFAASATATNLTRDWPEAYSLIKSGIPFAEKTGDSYLIGELCLWGIVDAFWTGWPEEDVEKSSERIREGINLAAKGIQSLEIPLQNQEITIAYGWYAECYRDLSTISSDLEKKKEYLNRAIGIARKGIEYSDPKLPNDSIHALAKSLYFQAKLEPNIEKRIQLLKESLRLREQTVRWGLALFPQAWDMGVMYNYLALVKAELSSNEKNPQAKLELLQGAVKDMQQCMELCKKWANGPSYMNATGYFGNWYGDILTKLYRLTGDKQAAQQALETYQGAITLFKKSGYQGQIPPIRWSIAKIHDGLGDYRVASEEFQRAANDYRHVAEKTHASAPTFTDLGFYMDTWCLIEKARLAHKDEQYSLAAKDYAEAASTLKKTRTWGDLTEHYEACSRLEEGEALSRGEREEQAVGSFSEAAEHFDAATHTLEARLKRSAGSDEEEELRDWLKLTEIRMRYAHGRAELEKARLLDGRGEKTASLASYRKASEIFKELLTKTLGEQGQREIETLVLFCNAWAKMKEAEAKVSAELYTEAAELFTKAEQAGQREQSDRLALANASICRALAAGTRFRRLRDSQLYSEIKRELETAADYYQEGGYAKAASWTRATQRLFDALLYLSDAEAEKDARKKAELYHLAEQHLQLAAKIYGEAGFTGKRNEALRHLERAREEKAILLTPLEVLAENPTVSAGAAQPASLLRDQALGAERYESANVVGNMSLREKDVNVGGDLSLELEIANVGKTPAMLLKLENLAPEGFEIQHDKTPLHVEDGFINMKGKRLEYLKTDEVKVALRALRKGAYKLRPRILFVDDKGSYRSYDFEPTEVTVSELGISGWLRGSGR